jgi:hypothetical protein
MNRSRRGRRPAAFAADVSVAQLRTDLLALRRLQWRFAPLSDLYLVYNDNYHTDDLGPRFRSFNVKVTYWFDM